MARAALTKLFILVILAFIVCLPEFFSLYRVSKVNFFCQPYQPCDPDNWVKKEEYGYNEAAEINRKAMCDPPQGPDDRHVKWERACTWDHQSNGTEPALNPRRGGEEPKDGWFVCRTDMDMAALHRNVSSSVLKVYLEVSVNLQLDNSGTLNLTLYGSGNHSSLYLHAPEEEEEQNKTSDKGQKESFYCCLPVPPTSESANQSHCLLWLANQTVLTAQEKLPWKRAQKGEWRCIFRVCWLALVCVILLTIVTTVIREIYWRKSRCKNPKVHPVEYTTTGQRLNDGEKRAGTPPKGAIPHTCESQHWSGLSPIPEIQEDIEMLLDGNVDNCYTAKLHHRGHPSTSSLTEEQVW